MNAVALINPKYPRNLANVLRACSNFGAERLVWTSERVPHPDDWEPGARLPREERMKLYRDVDLETYERHRVLDELVNRHHCTPVAVEVRENAERLPDFEHPIDAVYVFGPEDGSLDRGILSFCHRFVVIPSTSCLNLAAAVNVVLYDRLSKSGEHDQIMPHRTTIYDEVES